MALMEDIESSLLETSKLKDSVFNAISNILEEINQQNLQTKKIPSGRESIDEIQARLSGFCSLAEQVNKGTFDVTLVSYESLNNFKSHVDNINASMSDIISQLNRIKENGGIGAIDEQYIVSNKGNNDTYTLGQGLKKLDSSIDRALESYYILSPAIQRPDVSSLSSFTSNYKSVLSEQKTAKASTKRNATLLKRKLEEIKAQYEQISSFNNEAEEYKDEIEGFRNEAEEHKDEIHAILTESQEKKPLVEQALENAKDLNNKIASHHERLDEFDAKMEARENASLEGREKLSALLVEMEESKKQFEEYKEVQKKEIEELISRGIDMLSIDTSAGLGANFKKQANGRRIAILAAYFIIISCLLLIMYLGWNVVDEVADVKNVVDGVSDAQSAVDKDADTQNVKVGIKIEHILLKLSAVIPLGFLVFIMTRSLRKLELAKEYYEHKASVSQALEGYRRLFEGRKEDQIPEKVDLIKSTVKEVLKNPADKFPNTGKEDPNPLSVIEECAGSMEKIGNLFR